MGTSMIRAIRIRTEYLINPVGIDIVHPWVMWNVDGAKKQAAAEISYRINESESEKCVRIETDIMHCEIPDEMRSRDRVSFKIRLADETGQWGEWSDSQFFEMGLLHHTDWSAKWIMGDYEHSEKKDVRYPADYFRKSFKVGGKLKKARLYITACGLYEVQIDGRKVGEDVLTPGASAFQKRVNYQCYDVGLYFQGEAEALVGGCGDGKSVQHEVSVILADGFYASKTGCFDKEKVYGHEPKVIAQLELTYEDGRMEVIGTDGTWNWSNDGPVRFADMKDGEIVDENCVPSYVDNARETFYMGKLCCSNSNPPREHEVFSVPQIITCPDGNKVLDFGQNIAGFLSCDWCVPKGHKVSMICGEKLDSNGNFTVSNIKLKGDYEDGHFQRIDYIGDGKRHLYKTRFSIMGFQYVLLLNWPEEIAPESLKAIAVYSDMDVTADFVCSDSGVNQIVKNTLWSIKGNFMDVPTDCPTRERAGWTGDAQLFFNTGNTFMDQAAFFRKWLADVADCQNEEGMIFNINPCVPGTNRFINWISMESSCGWGDAMIMVPYRYWKRYGDIRVAKTYWDAMVKCFDFYKKRMGKAIPFSGIKPGRHKAYACGKGRGFGEWTEPDDCAPSKLALMKPICEENTAYLGYDARLMAEMAQELGRASEAKKYRKLYKNIKEAYEFYFLDAALKEEKRECKVVRPCGLYMVSRENREKLRKKLSEMSEARGNTVGTGFLSTPFLLEQLTKAGKSDQAWKILINPELGWMQQINQGATTVWENWTDDASLNHYSKGACCGWLFESVCGIHMDGRQNHFMVKPHKISALSSVSLSYLSAYGTISSKLWEEEGKTVFELLIPCNCTAQIMLPDGRQEALEAGEHRFIL